MTTGGCTLTGVAELRAAFQRFPAAVTTALQKVARDTALRVKAGARALVPVDSGITRDSIDVQPDPARKRYVVAVFNAPPHVRKGRKDRTAYLPNLPLWIEFGTIHNPARPFLRPALEAEDGRYQADMQAAADRVFRDTVGE